MKDFRCPLCNAVMRLPLSLVNKMVDCPTCQNSIFASAGPAATVPMSAPLAIERTALNPPAPPAINMERGKAIQTTPAAQRILRRRRANQKPLIMIVALGLLAGVVVIGLLWATLAASDSVLGELSRSITTANDSNFPSPLPPPPKLRQPIGLNVSDQQREDIEDIVSLYPRDQVSAYAELRSVARSLEKESKSIPWVNQALESLAHRAELVLDHDLEYAIKNNDLRRAYIAIAALDGFKSEAYSLEKACEQLRQLSIKPRETTWQVSNVVARRLDGFSEHQGNGSLSIDAPDHGELVRVTATVRKLENANDPAYVGLARLGVTRALSQFIQEFGGGKMKDEKAALASADLIFLVDAERRWYSSTFVPRNSQILRGMLHTTPESGGRQSCAGTMVQHTRPFEIDVIFTVPKNAQNLKLLVLGAEAHSLPLRDGA